MDAIKAASAPHHFLSVTKGGHSAIVHTAGNEDCHIILRGGKVPNFDATSVEATCKELASAGLAAKLMIDCSHANSQKKYERQVDAARDVSAQIAGGDERIFGVMRRAISIPEGSVPGEHSTAYRSPTHASKRDTTVGVLATLAESVRARRRWSPAARTQLLACRSCRPKSSKLADRAAAVRATNLARHPAVVTSGVAGAPVAGDQHVLRALTSTSSMLE